LAYTGKRGMTIPNPIRAMKTVIKTITNGVERICNLFSEYIPCYIG